jgi:hypothetical protein
MATDDNEPPPPDAMSWERRVSQPPRLNDQTGALPLWVRPFAKPEVERRAAALPMSVVLTQVSTPSAFIVSLVINALLGVPMRHMLFTVPATTIIGILLILVIFGAVELIGWASGYRAARLSWTLSGERTAEALASALERAAKARGFAIVWSKDDTFVATRNIEQGTRRLGAHAVEDTPLRLSLLPSPRNDAARTLKLGVHAICFWEAGETELLASLASNLVHEAAKREPWIAKP